MVSFSRLAPRIGCLNFHSLLELRRGLQYGRRLPIERETISNCSMLRHCPSWSRWTKTRMYLRSNHERCHCQRTNEQRCQRWAFASSDQQSSVNMPRSLLIWSDLIRSDSCRHPDSRTIRRRSSTVDFYPLTARRSSLAGKKNDSINFDNPRRMSLLEVKINGESNKSSKNLALKVSVGYRSSTGNDDVHLVGEHRRRRDEKGDLCGSTDAGEQRRSEWKQWKCQSRSTGEFLTDQCCPSTFPSSLEESERIYAT